MHSQSPREVLCADARRAEASQPRGGELGAHLHADHARADDRGGVRWAARAPPRDHASWPFAWRLGQLEVASYVKRPPNGFQIVGRPRRGAFHGGTAWFSVSPRLLNAIRLPLIRGRVLSDYGIARRVRALSDATYGSRRARR